MPSGHRTPPSPPGFLDVKHSPGPVVKNTAIAMYGVGGHQADRGGHFVSYINV